MIVKYKDQPFVNLDLVGCGGKVNITAKGKIGDIVVPCIAFNVSGATIHWRFEDERERDIVLRELESKIEIVKLSEPLPLVVK